MSHRGLYCSLKLIACGSFIHSTLGEAVSREPVEFSLDTMVEIIRCILSTMFPHGHNMTVLLVSLRYLTFEQDHYTIDYGV